MNEAALQKVFHTFEGHCHFCGDEIDIDKRGWAPDLRRRWEADHVIQRTKGGSNNPANFLPACTRCNRLRWGRSGSSLRLVLSIGLAAKSAAYHYPGSDMGPRLRRMRVTQRGENWIRRMRKALSKNGLSADDFERKGSALRALRAQLVNDLAEFEEHVYEELGDRIEKRNRKKRDGKKRTPKWNDVLVELRTKYQETGTQKQKAWLAAESALGE